MSVVASSTCTNGLAITALPRSALKDNRDHTTPRSRIGSRLTRHLSRDPRSPVRSKAGPGPFAPDLDLDLDHLADFIDNGTSTRKRGKRAMEKTFGVVSADGHCRLMHLPFDLWTKRLPRKFADDGPRIVQGPDGTRQWVVEGRPWSGVGWAGVGRGPVNCY